AASTRAVGLVLSVVVVTASAASGGGGKGLKADRTSARGAGSGCICAPAFVHSPSMADPRETPAMQQYYRFKRQHPDCVLFFRIGDFYEMFDDDAVTVSKAIGLTLTQRTEGVPMAGVPYHQLEVYLRRLIAQGFRVAVCEQI